MKMKILSIVAVMIISAVGVGFTPKLGVELVNDTIVSDGIINTLGVVEDYFKITEDKVFVELEGEVFDITEYCKLENDTFFTYEKQFDNYIQRIVISGEPNTKTGIIFITSIEDVTSDDEPLLTSGRFFTTRTSFYDAQYCCEQHIPDCADVLVNLAGL